MDQLKKLFASLTMPQKIGLALALLAVGIGVPMFTHWQKESDFKPLFTNMAPEDAAAVLQKLKESGVDHRLADNGMTVLVPEEKVNDVRLELAGAGLPKSGRIGFELFDKTNLGVTDFSEKVNYRRALEGELERTIKGINTIDSARVHITFPKDSVFLDNREPAKASVLVKLRVGAVLSPQNVVAISNLVGSAVEGLSPDAVTIVDMQGNLLTKRQRLADGTDSSDAVLEYRHAVEKDLTAKVESTLEPLLGDGRFRVGVSADCDLSTSEQTDETYDPTRSVMSTSQKTEDLSNTAMLGGVPGTPSNLPRSTIKPLAGPGSGSGMSRRTENTAFETSRSVRQVKMPRGSIKRISVAVLLDHDLVWQGQGAKRKQVLTAPPPERIQAIHDIVAGVLGIQADRGDQVVIESLPFEQTVANEDDIRALARGDKNAPLSSLNKLLADRRFQIGAGVAVLLLIAAVVFLLNGRRKSASREQAALPAGSDAQSTAKEALVNSKNADGSAKEIRAGATPALSSPSPVAALPTSPKLALPEMDSATQMMLHQIQDHVAKDPVFAANILRGWMAED